MLKNYVTTAIRNIWKYRSYSLINLLGLAIGMAACLMIFLFVRHELGFDRFHKQAENIYRLNEVQTFGGLTPQHVALSMYPMGEALKNDYAEITDYTRFWRMQDWLFRHGNKDIFIKEMVSTDTSIFAMFDFQLLSGDPSTALHEPNSIILTEETARKFFGSENPLGKELIRQDTLTYKITGVIADAPAKSHLRFDALVSMKTFDSEERSSRWGSNYLVTYLMLTPNANIANLEAQFPDFVTKYMGERGTEFYKLYLQPFTDVHLGSTHITHDYQNYQKFDRSYVNVFTILAIFTILIASINFMNISTARSASRAKEVGIRKTIGAQRGQLTGQFIGESLLMAFFAFILALFITQLSLPYLHQLSGRMLSLNQLSTPSLTLTIISAVFAVGLISGFYPAIMLSAYQPASVLKGSFKNPAGKVKLRNVLVVVQFSIAVALIVGTLLTVQQLNFMRQQNLGFNKDHVVLLSMSNMANRHYETLRTEFTSNPGVLAVTASGQRLGNNIHQMGSRYEGFDEGFGISVLNVDLNYLDFHNIEILDGRDFNPDSKADKDNSYIMNEALARKLDWDVPVGKGAKLSWKEEMGSVIGLAKNFNFNSLHHNVEPLLITSQDWGFSEMSVRIAPENMQASLTHLRSVWEKLVSDRPFNYEFLDAHFAQLYTADRQSSDVITIIAGLAVIIACLGLFGLSSITTAMRTKEIGIRKVLGASLVSLISMLSRGFIALVSIAFLIAIPFTIWFMESWLESFAYRIDIGFSTFLIAGILAISVALLTVCYHAIKTALANPVKALRYE